VLGAVPAAAQTVPPGDAADEWGELSRSPVMLPDGHWATRAAWRAEAMGLARGFLPARSQVSRDLVWAALSAAAANGSWRGLEVERLTHGWVERFTEEFPEYATDEPGPARPLGSALSADLLVARGRAGPGHAEFPPDRTGAEPLPDRTRAATRAEFAAGLGAHLAVHTQLQAESDSMAVRQLAVTARWRPLALTLGRDRVGYSTGRAGGTVLSGDVPLDGVQLESWRPMRGPGWLRYLGPVTFETFLGRIPGDRHPGDPFFWGARGALQPHPRLTLSVQRAALFGGAGSELPVNFSNVLHMLMGRVVGVSFEDQVVSVAGRFRLPTEETLPLAVYAEVGAEDASGSFRSVPGIIAGVESAAIPGAPWLSLGVEGSIFAHHCCGNPPWYRHHAFSGSWALDDRPLGHRLGGQGSEMVLHGAADIFDAKVRLGAEAFRRGRSGDNLYVPGREGGSLGSSGEVAWRFAPRAEVQAEAFGERGKGWSEQSLHLSARWFF
jgi:hypothetical protein